MEDITITLPKAVLEQGLIDSATEMFKSSYSNPMRNLLEECIKEKKEDFKTMIAKTISDILSNPEFQSRLTSELLTTIIKTGLSK